MFAIFMIVLVGALWFTDRWLGTRAGKKKANIPRGASKKFVPSRRK
jgi:hypothetical protein